MYTYYKCKICGFFEDKNTNFCSNCGKSEGFRPYRFEKEARLGKCDCGYVGYCSYQGKILICRNCGRSSVRAINRFDYLRIMDKRALRHRSNSYYEDLYNHNTNSPSFIEKEEDKEYSMDKDIEDLNFPKRLVTILRKNNISNTKDLGFLNISDIKRMKGIGPQFLELLNPYIDLYLVKNPQVEELNIKGV